jgi:2-methylfumaryl-CoA isomerase
VKLALEDVGLAVMGHLGFIAEAQLGPERGRHGNELFGAFGRDFTTADGERVMVVGLTGKQWSALCDAMEMNEEMAQIGQQLGLDLALEGNRFMARKEIARVVGAWIGARSLADVAAALDRHAACWSRYQTVGRMVRDDPSCSEANPLFATIDQPGVGKVLAPGIPLRFSGVAPVPPGPAPLLGADTEQVLYDLLGLDSAAFGRLHDQGIVATAGPAGGA